LVQRKAKKLHLKRFTWVLGIGSSFRHSYTYPRLPIPNEIKGKLIQFSKEITAPFIFDALSIPINPHISIFLPILGTSLIPTLSL